DRSRLGHRCLQQAGLQPTHQEDPALVRREPYFEFGRVLPLCACGDKIGDLLVEAALCRNDDERQALIQRHPCRKPKQGLWLEMVWQFDDANHYHCLLVAGLAAGFAQSLGLREADCQRLNQTEVLHDVGKAKIPASIFNKLAARTPEEREIMKQHPGYGHAMLRGSGFSEEMLGVVRWHHEALDGSGYPDGLQGSEIPDLVRLVSVCDVYG
ncbi:hypothetical protein EMGR_008022, partial [Emarellia grisea]